MKFTEWVERNDKVTGEHDGDHSIHIETHGLDKEANQEEKKMDKSRNRKHH